jgi:hypothetical protein
MERENGRESPTCRETEGDSGGDASDAFEDQESGSEGREGEVSAEDGSETSVEEAREVSATSTDDEVEKSMDEAPAEGIDESADNEKSAEEAFAAKEGEDSAEEGDCSEGEKSAEEAPAKEGEEIKGEKSAEDTSEAKPGETEHTTTAFLDPLTTETDAWNQRQLDFFTPGAWDGEGGTRFDPTRTRGFTDWLDRDYGSKTDLFRSDLRKEFTKAGDRETYKDADVGHIFSSGGNTLNNVFMQPSDMNQHMGARHDDINAALVGIAATEKALSDCKEFGAYDWNTLTFTPPTSFTESPFANMNAQDIVESGTAKLAEQGVRWIMVSLCMFEWCVLCFRESPHTPREHVAF